MAKLTPFEIRDMVWSGLHHVHPNMPLVMGHVERFLERIADLERELATALKTELSAAQATIAALQWTPITPDNLPKPLVHEVLDPVRGFVGTVFASWPYERSIEAGWLYFRPISPPAQATIETLNVQKGGTSYERTPSKNS